MLSPLVRSITLWATLCAAPVAHGQDGPPIPPPYTSPAPAPTPAPIPPAPIPAPVPAPSPTVAPTATITAPASVAPGSTLVAFGDLSVTTGRLSWVLIAPKGPYDVADLPGKPGAVFVVRKPVAGAVYKIALVAHGTGDPAYAFDFAEIPVGGGSPAPTPTPAPGPAPTPPPTPDPAPPFTPPQVTGPIWVTLVYELGDFSTIPLRISAIRADLKALNATWYEAPSVTPIGLKFAPVTAKTGLPVVILSDGSGNVIDTLKIDNPAAIVDRVKALRGTK